MGTVVEYSICRPTQKHAKFRQDASGTVAVSSVASAAVTATVVTVGCHAAENQTKAVGSYKWGLSGPNNGIGVGWGMRWFCHGIMTVPSVYIILYIV